MAKALLSAAASAFVLAACTHVPMASVSDSTPSASSAAGERYCWKRNLSESGGKLYCNWSPDRSRACERADSTPIEASRYSEPAAAGRCEDGNYLVRVQPR
jgi:hypothetical protein